MKKPGNESGSILWGCEKLRDLIYLRLYLNRKRLQKLRTYIFKFDQFDMISHVAPCLTMCENTDGVLF